MSLAPTSELEAVNRILVNIGESPINTLDNPGVVDAVRARQLLHDTSRTLQAQGWHWNRERDFPLTRSFPDKGIRVPANTLSAVITGCDTRSIVLRGARLYDTRKHTYAFEKNLTADLVVFLPFEELPEPARQFVTLSACRVYQENTVGSDTLAGFDRRDELRAWAALQNAEGEESGLSIFDDPSVTRVLGR